MNRHWNSYLNRAVSRRELLRASSAGFGSLALAGLLGEQMRAATTSGQGAAGPLSVKEPHFAPRRRAARTAHRQRHVRASVPGLLDHLRTGQRKPKHAGFYHDLPDAEPWRGE